MPRPTAAQLAYGSATVVFSTLAMLLLSQTRSGFGVTVIACTGLALGLLVALTVPAPRTGTTRSRREPAGQRSERLGSSVPRARTRSGSGARVEEHSLHR
ncbi:hypothetical protein [Streptomyces sp. NPDC047108]|uniref:hypothetical protein n=1 Tax=Streptomyces sp. NPDC047108 TaxID=3155025 RepID=UPI0033E94F0A